MIYFKALVSAVIALLLSILLLFAIVAVVVLGNTTPGTVVGLDVTSLVKWPLFWVVAVVSLSTGWYAMWRRRNTRQS